MQTKPAQDRVAWAIGSLLLALSLSAAQAQTFSLDWFTIDGGGGTSTGGVYSVSGTIGQPDAGKMSGGNFTLEGGFWAAIQVPSAPYLSITLTPTNTVVVWWALSETTWLLETTSDLLNPNSWTECSYQTEDAICYRIESPPVGNQFYRLKKP